MKKYIKPFSKEIKLNFHHSLLAGSGVETGNSISDEFSDRDISYSKDFDSSYDWNSSEEEEE